VTVAHFLVLYLKRQAAASILEPISTVLNYSYGDIRQGLTINPAIGEIFKRMLEETHSFVQSYIPEVEFKEVYRWIWDQMGRNIVKSNMLLSLNTGHVTNIESLNGTTVRRGKENVASRPRGMRI
jgi:ketopantoate reductase